MAETEDIGDEHTAFEADFSDNYDGSLPVARAQALSAHLAGCERCRAEYERFRGAMGAVASLHKVHAPQRFDEKVADTINRRSAGRFFGERSFGDRVPFELLAVIGLAIALIIFLLVRFSSTGALHEAMPHGATPTSDIKSVLPIP